MNGKFYKHQLEKRKNNSDNDIMRDYKKRLDDEIEYIDPQDIHPNLMIPPSVSTFKHPIPQSTRHFNDRDRHRMSRIMHNKKQYTLPYIKKDFMESELNAVYRSSKMALNNNTLKHSVRNSSTNVSLDRNNNEAMSLSKQQRINLIKDRLTKETEINSVDLYSGNNMDAEMKAHNLELQASMLDEQDDRMFDDARFDDENGSNNTEYNNTPDFVKQFPNGMDRDKNIDRYLGKEPLVQSKNGSELNIGGMNPNKNSTPVVPDLVILPVYADIKQYTKLLACKQEIIEHALDDMGIEQQRIITQETGQELFKKLRPKVDLMSEVWIDDVKSRLPYNKSNKDIMSKLDKRKPVLCVLGHVDHGKTTLLDYLRKTNVASNEAGGITQSIGAFSINVKEYNSECFYDEMVIFDTPGHAAFTGMRQRGANVVDLAILIVSATDGVQPQTKESLAIIRKYNLPYVIAINKVDRLEADVYMVKKQLKELDVFDNEIDMIEISAKTGQGINDLIDIIDTTLELYNPVGSFQENAEVVVVEAKKKYVI